MRALASTCFLFLSLISVFPSYADGDPFFLKTRAAELRAGGRVTILALSPGREDVAWAAYYRFVSGARVQFAYLTNGESTTYAGSGYPNQVAADLRRRAYVVAESMQAEHVFLNLPDIDAASDTTVLYATWDKDSVQARLLRIFGAFQPDLVLINGVERLETPAVVRDEVLSAVQAAIRQLRSGKRGSLPTIALPDLSQKERAPSTSSLPALDGRSLDDIANKLDAPYASLRAWFPRSRPTYSAVSGFPRKTLNAISDPSKLLTVPRPSDIAMQDSLLRSIGQEVARWRSLPTGKAADRVMSRLVQALGHIDVWVRTHPREAEPGRRILLDKRLVLEALRIKLLGIVPYWRISDSVLTNLQLTYLTIDSVQGLDKAGETQVFFPMVQQQWILNEGHENKANLVPGQPYRIISSRTIPYDLPRELNGLERSQYRTPWPFFIVHRATTPERSFSLRLDAGFLGAPRFAADILATPIVRATDGEEVVVRLTNNSRDGVRDTLTVIEPMVRSTKLYFRMNAKGTVESDTLRLLFDPEFPWGTQFVSVGVGPDELARFLARKFEAETSTKGPVLVFAPSAGDAAVVGLRRLGLAARLVNLQEHVAPEEWISTSHVAVVSEFALTAMTEVSAKVLQSFIVAGGRCIVLQQRSEDLKRSPMFSGMDATLTGDFDTTSVLTLDTLKSTWAIPNDIRKETWEGWVFRRASQRLNVQGDIEVLATLGIEHSPAVVRRTIGAGSIIYVNLNLGHQLLNVHPTAYQFLANLLAD